MARLTLILGVLATVVYLLDGFRFMLNEWRNWRNKGTWIVMLGLCLMPSLAEAACSGSSPTWTVADTSYAEVSACNTVASNGDTILIPAGSSTWDTELSVTKALTFQGAGTGATLLTRGTVGDANGLFHLSPTSDLAQRITAIGFVTCGAETGAEHDCIKITGPVSAENAFYKQRVDHNTFNKGNSGAIRIKGNAFGLVDHNTFTNGQTAIFLDRSGTQIPVRPWDTQWCNGFIGGDRVGGTAGTVNAVFIEDNAFLMDNNVDTLSHDATIYNTGPTRTVIRYNTFDATAFTTKSFHTLLTNDHGNQEWYTGADLNTRAQLLGEYYNNTATCYNCDQFFGERGGSMLIWGNTLSRTIPSSNYMQLTEEESWQTIFFSPLDTVWPAEDQMFNTFIWNNTCQGAACTITLGDALDAPFIQQDRDFFYHAPEASGGHEYFDNRCGAAGRGADGTLNFTASGANAYYPYTPYPYPHPLQGITPTTPAPSPVVIARVLRWMEVAAFVTGMGWHFRKQVMAMSLAALAGCGTLMQLAPRSYDTVKTVSKDSAVKVLTVFNDLTKPRS